MVTLGPTKLLFCDHVRAIETIIIYTTVVINDWSILIFPHFITTARFHWSRNYGNTLMLQTVFPTLLFFLDLALAGIIHITSPMLGSDYLFVRYFGKTLLNCSSLCCKWEHVLLYLDHRFAPLIIYSRHFRFFSLLRRLTSIVWRFFSPMLLLWGLLRCTFASMLHKSEMKYWAQCFIEDEGGEVADARFTNSIPFICS